ncbi:Asp23/Gls24 family envelope stress response protein [Youngiibacter multivorans]|uniref:Alkaline shock family protein YloU n=1 Tax=Youngiibacter multivorans TaxID=937251 RepID=A0ABS4G887_9CLOT|nr:Asp23/Gls24 family envelope stress response protein [Youngiibacter multivorans]MBP1920775.1 putative alkaline shock family protein YloU [Youngiibacter multivorans]MBW8382642.1 Asp23/Gls24 family envelope stress response protein [Youngiibacter sp.]
MSEKAKNTYGQGVVKISEDVVGVIAGIAASEIKGVAGLSATLTGGITQVVTGKRNVTKGVKVTVGEKDAIIDMIISVEYGFRIPDVVEKVQENVLTTVEAITGLKVSAVNIFVNNIYVKGKEQEPKEK